MARSLTKKQKGFVKDYLKTGNGTQAALKNYEIAAKDPEKSASVIASENLGKLSVQKAIADLIPDDLLRERHLELLNKREIYTIGHGEDQEVEVIDQPDTQAVSKALDMAYKLKGSYAAERVETRNLNVEVKLDNTKAEALRLKFEDELKQELLK